MTADPIFVGSETRLSEAMALMERHRIRHLPVVDEGVLVGILSERHLRDAMPSVLALHDREARRRSLAAVRVSAVCVPDPVTVTTEDSVLDAIQLMRTHRAGSLPVLLHGRLAGILTSGDLIQLLEHLLRG